LSEQQHQLYVLYKGFQSETELEQAIALFSAADARSIKLADLGLDIGAYLTAVNEIGEGEICFLNTHSEILAPRWLEKLALHIRRPEVGLVGATGSFESLSTLDPQFPAFPNVHLRSNGFMIQRELFRSILNGINIRYKFDAYYVESGPLNLTRQILAKGLSVLVVGRNGRGYPPRWWPSSDTFRQGRQANLLIGDNVTRAYIAAPWNAKRAMIEQTWGKYLDWRNRCSC
jgi:hypothetical protein